MNNGDRVEWTFERINSNQYKRKINLSTKTGTFEKLIKHKNNWTGEQLAVVYIDNNITATKIPVSELKLQEK